jgi:hypothetical protein
LPQACLGWLLTRPGPWVRDEHPTFAAYLPAGVQQIPSDEYRNPDALPPAAVLVVGSAQIVRFQEATRARPIR